MSLKRDLLANTITPRPRPQRRNLRVATVIVLLAVIVSSASVAVAVIADRRADQAQDRAALAERLLIAEWGNKGDR